MVQDARASRSRIASRTAFNISFYVLSSPTPSLLDCAVRSNIAGLREDGSCLRPGQFDDFVNALSQTYNPKDPWERSLRNYRV